MADDELKFGARNNRNDQQRIQSAHDLMVENGAVCARGKHVDDFDNSLKSISETPDELRVANYMILFGGRDLTGLAGQKNRDGSLGEYFTKSTLFDSDYTKSGRLYVDFEHGMDLDDVGADEHAILGYVDWKTANIDERGVFVQRVLNRRQKYMEWLEPLIKEGLVGNSSAAVPGTVKRSDNGEIQEWRLMRDSITVNPAESRMMSENAVRAIKALAEHFQELKNIVPLAQAAETAPVIVSNSIPDKEPNVADIAFTPEELQAMKDAMSKVGEMQASVEEMSKSIKAIQKSQPATVSAGAVSVVTDAADQPFKSTGEFLLAVKNAAINPAQEDIRLRGKKAITGLGEQVPADGGYLVQSTVANGIVERMYTTGKIMSRVSKDNIGPNSNGMVYNGIDETSRVDGSRWGGLRAYWLAEGGTKTSSQPSFRQIELKLKKIAALAYATDELLQDATALEGWINRTVPQELNFRVEDAFYEGDGVGKPLGITNSPALVSVLRADANKIQAADILNMWARRWTGVSDYVWLVNQDIMPQLMTMAGTYQYLWMPQGGLSQAPYSTLMGIPMLEVEYASTMGTVGDITLAALSQYQAIDKGGVQSASSIHVAFLTDQQVFRFVYRVDGAPMWHSPLTPFKGTNTQSPFVTLATASA
jgi:HK97 family phage major capsid protein